MKNKLSPEQEHLKDSTSREKVLKKVRHALLEPSDNPFKDVDFESAIYKKPEEEDDILFALELSKLGGNFIYCTSPTDMLLKVKGLFIDNKWEEAWCNEELLTGLLNHAEIKTSTNNESSFKKISVTSCECLIARTGSVLVSSALQSGRQLPLIADIHIVIAFTSQVVYDIKQAIEVLKMKYKDKVPSMISIITGTSRSDDIEKIMVTGGHGPKELYVFMADEGTTDK